MAAPTIRSTGALASSGTTNQSSIAVGMPAGATVGDLLLLDVSTNYSGGGTAGVSAPGWTLKHHAQSGNSGKDWLWRICDGTEGASVTVTETGSSPGSTRWKARISAITVGTFNSSTPFDSSSGASGFSATAVTPFNCGSFTPSQADCLVIASLQNDRASVRHADFTSPAVELYDDSVLNHLAAIAAARVSSPTAGVSTSISGNWNEGTTAWIGVTIVVAPVPAVVAPVADFSATPTSGTSPLTVAFTDLSTHAPTSWDWDFGDGSTHGTTQNPSHNYAAAGSYTVVLTATNAGGSDSETKVAYIVVSAPVPPPVADFSGTPLAGDAPLLVTFTDASTGTPTSWAWDFENNGSTDSTSQNPTHTYSVPGTYTVKLTATNAGGSDVETKTAYVVVTEPLVASFDADPTSGEIPLEVEFADTSSGDPTAWDWDFGDGFTSTEQNPTHVYEFVGTYTVTLTVGRGGGAESDTVTEVDLIVTGTRPAIEGVSIATLDAALEPFPTWERIDNLTPTLVAEYEIRRGRQDEFEKTGTGHATIRLHDREGMTDPTNPGSPWIGALDGAQAGIGLRNPVTGEWTTIFRGFVDEYDYDVHPSGIVTDVDVELVDALDFLAGCEVAPGTNAAGDNPPSSVKVPAGDVWYEADEVNLRIHKLLDQAGWPEALRNVFTGNVWVREQVAAAGTSILQLLMDAADAEFPGVANIFVTGNGYNAGNVTFHGRHARFDPDSVAEGAGAAWDFTRWFAGDGSATADPTYAQIRGLGFTRQRKQIINAALAYPFRDPDIAPGEITEAQMAAQPVKDDLSIERYGVRSWSAESLMTWKHKTNGNSDLVETKAMANYYVQNYAQPRTRLTRLIFRSIHPDDPRAAATWALICGVEISDVVTVKTAHPGGGGFDDEEFYVEGISYSVRPLNPDYADVTLTLDVSPKAFYDFDPF